METPKKHIAKFSWVMKKPTFSSIKNFLLEEGGDLGKLNQKSID